MHFKSNVFPLLSSFSLLQESRKRVKLEKKEPLVESQLFIMELARELNKICQVSAPLPLPLFLSAADERAPALHLICVNLCRHPRGQTSSVTSGPARTSGRPACVVISSWNGLPCWRRECRYVWPTVCVINNLISYMLWCVHYDAFRCLVLSG